MNTITIELCAEDRARLDAILEALQHRPDCKNCVRGVTTYVAAALGEAAPEDKHEAQEALTPKFEEVQVETPFDEPEHFSAPVEAVKPVKRKDVQSLVATLSAAGKKAEVREIVTTFADRVSEIPESAIPTVYERLSKLANKV